MKYSLLILCSLLFTIGHAQSTKVFHRAKISLIDKDIHQLSRLGIETDHGIFEPKRSLECDYSEYELYLIAKAGFTYEILIEDVVSYYQDPNRPSELDKIYSRSGHCETTESCVISEYNTPQYYSGGSMGGYKTYSEMVAALDSMSMLFPNLITPRIDISDDTTHMGNKVFYLKISDNPSEDEVEPQVLYTALHHAREPNGMAQMLFYMWYVLENYETDPEIKALVDNNEMYFIPCVNPDGYMLNEINQPGGGGLWRKNAKVNENGQLVGVDLNRNYGYFWGFDDNGSSPNENSQTYRGAFGFSEPETQAVKQLCESKNILIALNYHTFGNLLIHPWGYNDQPTDEDKLFKGIGGEMSHENCYSLGTGTETVGYVVNGDSDDWMYGEETTKNKIYSLTPEVGPSFWPPQQDIVELNKSCVAMNIATAQLTANLHEIKNNTQSPIDPSITSLDIEVTKIGLGAGAVSLTISPLSNNIIGNIETKSVDIQPGQSEVLSYTFDYANDIVNGDNVEISVLIEGTGFSKVEVYDFTYFENEKEVLLTDITDDIDLWNKTGDWNITTEVAYEGTLSLADSPFTNYRRNASSNITLKETFDLTGTTYAELNFAAIWDIENNYDYAMVLASKDGINFNPLCGIYTNPGVSDQILDEPLYDGVQLDWVLETISLQDYIGEDSVYIRFSITSDGFVEGAGIYIDNIKVNTIIETLSNTKDDLLDNIVLYPNPVTDILTINGLKTSTKINIMIYDISGRMLITSDQHSIDISALEKGLYSVTINNQNTTKSYKIVKI